MKNLEKYFRECDKNGTIDHALRATVTNDKVVFYIHPTNATGDTLDFEIEDNTLLPLSNEDLSKPEKVNLNFGQALDLCKKGIRIAREGWNGKGMFVVYQKGYPQGIPCNKQTAEAWGLKEFELFKCNPYLQIKCADGSHSMWVPSINDILAEDWVLVYSNDIELA